MADTHTEAGRYGEFVREILVAADADVDFSRYDNDGPDGVPASGDDDGFVDLLILVLPEVPENLLRGPTTGIAGLGFDQPFITDDSGPGGAVRVDPRTGAVHQGRTFAEAVGTACHEFGHGLGLPDLFDIDFVRSPEPLPPERDSAGIGAWGLMGWGATGWNGDDGPNSLSGWSLRQLGWARVQHLTEPVQRIALADVGRRGDVLEIGVSAGERFLLEYRRRTSSHYDRNLPGEGLLIWREERDPVRSGRTVVTLECADGRWRDAGYPHGDRAAPADGGTNLDFWSHDAVYARGHGGNLGDATDPFDGVRRARFTPDTNPSSASRTGGVPLLVEDIRVEDDTVRVRVTTAAPALRIGRADRELGQARIRHVFALEPVPDQSFPLHPTGVPAGSCRRR